MFCRWDLLQGMLWCIVWPQRIWIWRRSWSTDSHAIGTSGTSLDSLFQDDLFSHCHNLKTTFFSLFLPVDECLVKKIRNKLHLMVVEIAISFVRIDVTRGTWQRVSNSAVKITTDFFKLRHKYLLRSDKQTTYMGIFQKAFYPRLKSKWAMY